jgi:hypothetical protein
MPVVDDEQAQAAAAAVAAVASCAASSSSSGSPYATKCLAIKQAAVKCWSMLKRELKPKARRRLVLVDLDSSTPSSPAESSADCLSPDTSRQLEAAAALAAAEAAAAAAAAAASCRGSSDSEPADAAAAGGGGGGGPAVSGAEVGHASVLQQMAAGSDKVRHT